MVLNSNIMKDRCPKSVGDAKQTLEIRVSQKEATKDADGNKSEDVLLCRYLSCTSTRAQNGKELRARTTVSATIFS